MKPIAESTTTAMAQISMQKAIAEVQARITVAKADRRDWAEVEIEVLKACQNPKLAEEAVWEFPRSGKGMDGPSIRLMEEIFRIAGNLDAGTRELGRDENGMSMEAFAIDLETNNRDSREFYVPFKRTTRKGSYMLTDQRDQYETAQNQAQRRKRACMQAVVPEELINRAKQTANETMLKMADTRPEKVDKLIEAFGKYGVTPKMVEDELGVKIRQLTPRKLVKLKRIGQSLKSGEYVGADFFTGAKQARLIEAKLEADEKSIEAPPAEPKEQADWMFEKS